MQGIHRMESLQSNIIVGNMFVMTDSLDDPFALASLRESAGNEAIEQRRKNLTASFAIADVQAATWQVTAIPLQINSAWNPNLNVFSIATCRLTRTHMYCTVQYPSLRLHICINMAPCV